MFPSIITLSLLAATAIAGPLERNHRRDVKAHTSDITIHDSCNPVQKRMLNQALKDTFEVVSFAKDYVTANGAQDPIFKLYFGDKPEAFTNVVGVLDSVLHSNKEGVLFRCDDPDNNCRLPGYRGHWRGENGSTETVICEASYKDRLYNPAFCSGGFQLATMKPSQYWSIDLLHRLFHVPPVTNGVVDHYTENLAEVIELSKHNSSFSPFDSDAQQFFAAHVYALEVAKGGDACIGDVANAVPPPATPDAAPAASSSPSAAAPPAAATSGKDCHSHADGTTHCV